MFAIWVITLIASLGFMALEAQYCIYDLQKTFEQNCLKEPLQSLQQEHQHRLFGHPLASRIGVAACAATSSAGIAYAARNGFDVLTYKTIRSKKCAAYALPNVCFVLCDHQLTSQDLGKTFLVADNQPDLDSLAISNSFGNACMEPEWVMQDIAKARAALHKGQVLIVSVFGDGADTAALVDDFVATACMAWHAGAQVIELNLSCPNIASACLYKDADLVALIAEAIHKALPEAPLVIKIGIFDTKKQMRSVLKAAAYAGVQGIAGINSVPVKIITQQADPVFGAQRAISGMSGTPIRSLALQFVKDAKEIIEQENLNLEIIAIGGITKPEHFQEFLDAGAAIALSATGFMWNSDLGLEYQHMQEKKEIIRALYEIGAIQFGDFVYKSGQRSHLYMDMRKLISAPELMQRVARQCAWIAKDLSYDLVCGVPYGAVPIATAFSLETKKPMIFKREKPKEYGMKKLIEGIFEPGNTCLVIEDVVTTGGSARSTICSLREHELCITDLLVLVDHEKGAQEELKKKGCHVHSLFTRNEILHTLLFAGIITEQQYALANESIV